MFLPSRSIFLFKKRDLDQQNTKQHSETTIFAPINPFVGLAYQAGLCTPLLALPSYEQFNF